MFAPMTWACELLPGILREKHDLRGSVARMTWSCVFIAEFERHPVADRRQVGIAGGLMPDAAAKHDVDFLAVAEKRAEVDRRLADQASGHPAFRAAGREGGFEIRIPAEFLEGHPPHNLARDGALSIPGFGWN